MMMVVVRRFTSLGGRGDTRKSTRSNRRIREGDQADKNQRRIRWDQEVVGRAA
jgi:hypothetical protein